MVIGRRRRLDRNALDDLQAVGFEAYPLLGVVREQTQVLHAEIDEHLRADTVVALVGLEAEGLVRFDGVLALVLELISPHLVDETNAPTFLPQVHEDTATGFLDDLEGPAELRAAIAATALEHIAEQT